MLYYCLSETSLSVCHALNRQAHGRKALRVQWDLQYGDFSSHCLLKIEWWHDSINHCQKTTYPQRCFRHSLLHFRLEAIKETEVTKEILELGSLDHQVLLGPQVQLHMVNLMALSTFQSLDLRDLQAIQWVVTFRSYLFYAYFSK